MTDPQMVRRTFTVDELEDLEVTDNGPAVLEDQVVEKRRWYNLHRVVFRHGDELWAVRYQEPLTEIQEGLEAFDEDPVPAVLVEAHEVTNTAYRVVLR